MVECVFREKPLAEVCGSVREAWVREASGGSVQEAEIVVVRHKRKDRPEAAQGAKAALPN